MTIRTIVMAFYIATAILLCTGASAQRKITPVQPGKPNPEATDTPRKPDMDKLAHFQDEQGNIILVDTVTGQEYADTLARRIPRMQYPLMHSLDIGVNIWDPVMRIFGQKYGIADASVSLGLHNRYFPTFEAGLSKTDDTPAGSNFTFRSGMAPYFKIGADYNFFYNSNPAYRLMPGVRYALTNFSSSVDDVTIDNGYWPGQEHVNFPSQRITAGYLEVMLTLRVKIAGPFMMGWSLKYHTLLHESKAQYGPPMTIPGFGKRNSPITGAFSLIYSFTLNKPQIETVE